MHCSLPYSCIKTLADVPAEDWSEVTVVISYGLPVGSIIKTNLYTVDYKYGIKTQIPIWSTEVLHLTNNINDFWLLGLISSQIDFIDSVLRSVLCQHGYLHLT